jgi:hypothetical protein
MTEHGFFRAQADADDFRRLVGGSLAACGLLFFWRIVH